METFSAVVPPSMLDDESALRSYLTRTAAQQGFHVDPAAQVRTRLLETRPELVGDPELDAGPLGRAEVDVERVCPQDDTVLEPHYYADGTGTPRSYACRTCGRRYRLDGTLI